MKKKHLQYSIILLSFLFISSYYCTDLTGLAFGTKRVGLPAAFGDFNSDELTDLFVIRKNEKGSSVEILLGSTKEPYFNSVGLVCNYSQRVVSVVPGDFDGDALMDMLVIATPIPPNGFLNNGYIAWGNVTSLECIDEPLFQIMDEPLAIDFSKNMKADLFGVNKTGSRVLWLFNSSRVSPQEIPLKLPSTALCELRTPHSHAFLDLNGDNWPDLYLTSKCGFEVWLWDNDASTFNYNNTIKSVPVDSSVVGQTLFMDLETADELNQIVPVTNGRNSSLLVYLDGEWHDLNVNFKGPKNQWAFLLPGMGAFPDTLTLHAGDFNNDGFVDILATLAQAVNMDQRGVFLFENVPCSKNCKISRTFEIQWNALEPFGTNSVMGIFYDFMQDGILDIIFVKQEKDKKIMSAFKNDLDYDANFIKVMVITGLTNDKIDLPPTLLGTKRHVFGSNLAGPKIRYKTTTQDGTSRTGVAVQLPQSAHLALYLPYTIFGLGRTPNFIEDLTISLFNKSRTWNQIIPNSQLIVAPKGEPSQWTAQLFVTPSKIVLQTVVALTGTCIVIGCIIAMLHWKERKEDRIERLQEAHRFHFDAM
ncbi:T-cell immunomodulatory protein [Planococcus citri]|uniref:T-cell immunomodulatory protein n=1 Tax=Planococcus citri TaxID=170843 RepID=UPI0031F7D888